MHQDFKRIDRSSKKRSFTFLGPASAPAANEGQQCNSQCHTKHTSNAGSPVRRERMIVRAAHRPPLQRSTRRNFGNQDFRDTTPAECGNAARAASRRFGSVTNETPAAGERTRISASLHPENVPTRRATRRRALSRELRVDRLLTTSRHEGWFQLFTGEVIRRPAFTLCLVSNRALSIVVLILNRTKTIHFHKLLATSSLRSGSR